MNCSSVGLHICLKEMKGKNKGINLVFQPRSTLAQLNISILWTETEKHWLDVRGYHCWSRLFPHFSTVFCLAFQGWILVFCYHKPVFFQCLCSRAVHQRQETVCVSSEALRLSHTLEWGRGSILQAKQNIFHSRLRCSLATTLCNNNAKLVCRAGSWNAKRLGKEGRN